MSVEQDLQQIMSARYGKDVRQSIYDAIYDINEVAKRAEYDASTAPESAKAYAEAALASLQAAEDAQQAAEDAAAEAMSGTPTGYSDLVAKVNSIYQETADSFSLEDTVEGLALAHTIYGMSEQDGTPTPSVPVDIDSAVANFTCTNSDSTNTITITTNLTLRAIEVSATDAYNLVKDGKYYVADSVDWSEDDGYVLTRRIGRLSLTDNFQNYNAPSGGQGYVERYFANPIVNSSILGTNAYNAGTPLSICNCAENGLISASSSGKFLILASGTANQRIRINVPDNVTDTTTAETWATSNGLYIDFILATPTTESITSAQAQALLSLKTYDEATNIDCVEDVAPVMDLEYSKDRYTALALTGHNMAYINDLRIGELENA